jgi:hypothetical protein
MVDLLQGFLRELQLLGGVIFVKFFILEPPNPL